MAKHAASTDNQCAPKRVRINEGTCLAASSPKADEGAWRILETFLMTDTTYPQTEEAFVSYLGDRYSAEDWKDALAALFSGDGDDMIVPFNPYINDRAEVDDDDDDDDDKEEEEEEEHRLFNRFIDDQARNSDEDDAEEDINGSSVQVSNIMSMPGSSAKNRLAAAIDDIVGKYQEKPRYSSRGHLPYKAAWSPSTVEKGCISFKFTVHLFLILYYVTHRVTKTATQYIAEHLQSKGFSVTVSTWVPGQLYVVSESPKTISAHLPPSHNLLVREYLRISEEEREAVECSNVKLPNPLWVRIKHGKYKDTIAYVFDSEESNSFVKVLVPPRDFPYPMAKGSVTLLDSSRLPKNNTVTDITHDEEVVGCSYKGAKYYKGLLLKDCHCYHLECVASPHVNDIQLHLQSGWDTSFMKRTIMAFLMQFLHAGDAVRIVKGEVHSETSTVLSIDHVLGSACVELTFDGDQVEMEVQLQDLERVFCIGDTVWVVVGAYLGLEGHAIQISGDIFHICQDISKEEVQVSKYYLDRHPINHTFQPRLPTMQQHYEPPPDESIQVRDPIEVLMGEHIGKCRIVSWFPVGVVQLWFRDANPVFIEDETEYLGPPIIQVATTFVRRTHLSQTITYTKERGYDIRPGDVTSWDVNSQDINTTDTNTAEGPLLSVDPSSSTLDPWTVDAQDIQDSINTRAEKVQDNGPLPWLMSREFALQFLTYHALLKVSLKFNGGGGKLHRRFVSTACPDPFCGANGPAPEGFVAVFCASSNKGAMLQHYHIPTSDLCPAPPRRKNQLCLILDGDFRGQIRTVSKCNVKLSTAELVIEGSDAPSISLRFDQICLVECFMVP
ncbi:uncharacterized protein F5891DRAFT_1198371 [Suillus fuscotomentosus]|uniref:Uncharacterized protein n=1 Tax=Suillus fuscotomentosus TaxID=1912939 RepID=A0AAD4DSK6_9AGAM|nr:uncharacterized protein F5891DRAFT_1198371 [Suillus fuscotomentosus]KAG1889783.1 hypothetical protein F5891DRAFT_1198371 [Suillus fuscotomentosus]